MAVQNLTRTKTFNQRGKVSVVDFELDYTDNVATSGDNYELCVLPANCVILASTIFVETASDAATSASGVVGTVDDTDEIITATNLKSAGFSTGNQVHYPTGATVVFTPTYTGATTVGKFRVVLEFIELGRRDGDLLNYSETV